MNHLSQLLVDLGRAGVALAPHPERSGVILLRGAGMTLDLRERLRALKADVLAMLIYGFPPDPGCGPTPSSESLKAFLERLGAAGKQGLPTYTGSPSWLLAVSEALDKNINDEPLVAGHERPKTRPPP